MTTHEEVPQDETTTSEENVKEFHCFAPEEADLFLSELETLANTQGGRWDTLYHEVIDTATHFHEAFTELMEKGSSEGLSNTDKEKNVHTLFETAIKEAAQELRNSLEESGQELGKDSSLFFLSYISDEELSHLNSNTLALHIARISEHADTKHAA